MARRRPSICRANSNVGQDGILRGGWQPPPVAGKLGRTAVLIAALSSLLAAPSPDAATLSEQALKRASEKHFDEAESLWNEAIAESPKYYPALFNLGYFYFQQERLRDAVAMLERASASAPNEFNAPYLLGTALMKLRKPDDALRAWREALRIQPENRRLMQVMSVEYSKGRYFGEAAALAKRALELKPDDLNLYLLAIKASQDAGDYAAASDIAKRAVARFPDSARANFEYAFHLQKDGKVTEAIKFLQVAMKLDPGYEEPFFFYGNILSDEGRNEDSLPYLRKAIENRNDYVPARVMLARALMNLKQWDAAIAELNETVQLDPKHPQPHLLLSQIYFRLGDEAKAKTEKETSLHLRRDNPAILEALQSRPFPAK